MKRVLALIVGTLCWLQVGIQLAPAWDYEGHRFINQLALSALPTNFPGFVRAPAAAERIAFLSGEPDRWRNMQDLPLRHVNGPEHYLDIEALAEYELKPELLPVFRYEFVAQLALYRKEHPGKFEAINAGRNEDHTRELIGLLPWGIAESYARLKSGFSYLKTFEQDGGTPDEVANAQADIVYVMGIMGHLVGDAVQPLHTTIHHHGWVGANPNGYSTNSRIHGWIDGGYISRVGGLGFSAMEQRLRRARTVALGDRPAKPEELFQAAMLFIVEQNKLVEPFYQMEKEGKFSGEGEAGRQGKEFLENQFVKGAQMLADIWFSAWEQAPPDTFLKGQLARRKAPAAGVPETK